MVPGGTGLGALFDLTMATWGSTTVKAFDAERCGRLGPPVGESVA